MMKPTKMSSSSSESDGDDGAVCKIYQWKKRADVYPIKIRVETEISVSVTL